MRSDDDLKRNVQRTFLQESCSRGSFRCDVRNMVDEILKEDVDKFRESCTPMWGRALRLPRSGC